MLSKLVFVGFVLDNNGKLIGARLSDIAKNESSLISIESLKNGLNKGIKILNISVQGNEFNILGNKNNYTLYKSDKSILKNGKELLVQLDDGSWLIVNTSGKVNKVESLFKADQKAKEHYLDLINRLNSGYELNNYIQIPNESFIKKNLANKVDSRPSNCDIKIDEYKSLNDIEILRKLINRDYTDYIKRHLQIMSNELRGKNIDIQVNNIIFSLEKSIFTAYYKDFRGELRKVKRFSNFKIKSIFCTSLDNNEEGNMITLLSDQVCTDVNDFRFKSIVYKNHWINCEFRIQDILYIRNINNWIGNRDILDELAKVSSQDYDSISNIELAIFRPEHGEFIVICSNYIRTGTVFNALQLHEELDLSATIIYTDPKFNFKRNKSLIYSLLNINVRSYEIQRLVVDNPELVSKYNFFNIASQLDYIRSKLRINDEKMSGPYKISAIKDSNMYTKMTNKSTKDKINIYRNRKILTLCNWDNNYEIVDIYKDNLRECNLILSNRSLANNDYKEMTISQLSKEQIGKLLNSLESGVVYKDVPIVSLDKSFDSSMCTSTMYLMKLNTYHTNIYFDGKYNLASLGLNNVVSESILDQYKAIVGSDSAVYLVYRAVLKYDKSIPRCKEQLMFNGRIEDILDKIVIDEVISEKDNLVLIYVDHYVIEAQLSVIKDALISIYKKYEKINNNSDMSLDIMKVAGGIDSINDNIIINKKSNGMNISIPDNIHSIIIDGDRDRIELNKLIVKSNISLEYKNYSPFFVKQLDISGKANNFIQRYSKSNSKLIYKHCKIHDLNISGRTLYDLMLTILYVNECMFPNKYIEGRDNIMVSSRESSVVSYVNLPYKNVISAKALENLVVSIHNEYDLQLSEKSLLSLLKYIESLKDFGKLSKLMNCNNLDVIARYFVILGNVLLSYGFNSYCCNGIINKGKSYYKVSIED